MLCPCKGCECRELGCHSRCEKYKMWRLTFEADRIKRLKRLEAIDFRDRSAVRALHRINYYGFKRR